MKSFLWGCLFVSACLATFALGDDDPAKGAKEDIKRIEGMWMIDEVIVDGIKVEFDELKNFTVVNGDDGSWILQLSGKEVSRGMSTYDQTKTPNEFDFMSTDSDGKETRFIGIYELDEKTRKICYTKASNPRPKEFASTSVNQCALVTLARAKKE